MNELIEDLKQTNLFSGIEPQEIDSNRPIAVPVVGDIASSMQGMLAELKQNTFTTPLVWRDILNIHKQFEGSFIPPMLLRGFTVNYEK